MKSWRYLPLEEFGKITSSKRIFQKEYVSSGIPFYRTKEIKELANKQKVTTELFIGKNRFQEIKSKFGVPKIGDILITAIGTIGEIYVVDSNDDFYFKDGNVLWLKDFKETNPFFLKYSLVSLLNELNNLSSGSTYKALPIDKLKKHKIYLPPIKEQERIVTILDKADAIRRKRKEAIALTEELLRSTFLDMFGDPVTNPKGWKMDLFGNVGVLNRGKSKHRPRNDPSLLNGKYPLIQTGDVANCKGVIESYTQTYSEIGLAQSKMWDAGTLCITIAANIAKTGILGFDACFPDSIVGFQPNRKTNNEYIQGWLQFLQPVLEDRAPQSAQKNINLEILRKLDLPVPPIELQRKFSSFAQKMRDSAKKNESNEILLDNLFNSLLQKAFRAEL